MKKYLSVFLTAAMITILLAGCGGSSASGSSESGAPAPEAGKVETAQAPAQEVVNPEDASAQEDISTETVSAQDSTSTETASAQDSTSTDAASAQDNTSTETASAQDQDASAATKGFMRLSQTINDPSGHLNAKFTYYEDQSLASLIMDGNPTDDNYSYFVTIYDREYDEEGKWTGSTNYRVTDITDVEGINLDDYRKEENIVSTEVCKYDDNGFIVERNDLYGNLTDRYTYNSKGQRILSETFHEGDVLDSIESTYNEQGILIKNVSKGLNDVLQEFTPFGVTTLETLAERKSESGDNTDKLELQYDDKGILTGGEWYSDGELSSSQKYELDENGNIIKISTFDKDGNLITIAENEIVPVNQ